MDYSKLTDGEIEELIIKKVMLTRPWRSMGYSTDPTAAKEVLKRIGELGKFWEFVTELRVKCGITDVRFSNGSANSITYRPRAVFEMLNATPRQICEAALMTMEEKS